ncbi:ABC transporter substrate-binding protein [Corynebacterium sp. AOP40-9SA-29]|uniref:ABC transporter substrate-binding protein n=1 Tax=Corynebacterium sp. AOP40-9SA-29 TaxID=3457677 RepID=UPI004033D133
MTTPNNTVSAAGITRRAFFAGALGLGAAGLLAACGSSGNSGSGGSGDGDAQSSGAASGSGDQALRVVALNTGQFETCLALGVLPVGIALASSVGTVSDGIPDFVKDRFGADFDLDSVESVGERQSPDMEAVARLEPELILSNKRADSTILEQLEQLAEVVLSNGGSEEWKADLGIIGEALGASEAADDLLSSYEERAADWAERRGSDGTVSLVRGKGDEYLMMGARALASIVAVDSGLTRPENQTFDDAPGHDISLENAADLDADWLFYGFPQGASEVTSSNSWTALPVVEDGRSFEVEVDPWFLNASVVAADRVLDDMMEFIGDA